MTWQNELDELDQRRQLLAEGSDPIRLERALSQDKMRMRERVEYLADTGSFRPHGGLSGQEKRDEDGNVPASCPPDHSPAAAQSMAAARTLQATTRQSDKTRRTARVGITAESPDLPKTSRTTPGRH